MTQKVRIDQDDDIARSKGTVPRPVQHLEEEHTGQSTEAQSLSEGRGAQEHMTFIALISASNVISK